MTITTCDLQNKASKKNLVNRPAILILAGFIAILAILAAATSIGLNSLNSLNDRLQVVVKENNVKSLMMTKMRDVIRERMLVVYTILNLEDPFEIEDKWEEFSAYAREFIKTRERLFEIGVTPRQREQLEAQRVFLGKAQGVLAEVFELVRAGEYENAKAQVLLAHQNNNRVMDELQQMRALQQTVAEQSVGEAAQAYAEARQQILTLVSLAVAICAFIIWFVVHRITCQAKALADALGALEESNNLLESRVIERTNELMTARAENMRMSAELAITRKLQQMLLPRDEELEQIPGLDIAGFMEPADEVGGDYYDVLQYAGRIIIGIGDVTGHGLESSVLMLMVQMAVRTLTASNITDPVQFLNILNRTVYDNVQRMRCDKNLTLILLDYTAGVLTLSGQHEEMIVLRKEGYQIERIDTMDLGFPIGLEQDISIYIRQVRVNLQPGDTVVLYTDGVTEAENNKGELYEVEQLCRIIQQNMDKSVQDIRHAVIEDVRRHIGTHKVYDDITLLVLKQL